MGTNYYMMTRNKELVKEYFEGEYSIVDTPFFGYEIHIGKRSIGWKPLFQAHKNAYNSVAEMKDFIKKHKNEIQIYDEYEREFTLEELEKELIDWGRSEEVIRYLKYVPEGVPDEVFGGKKYLVESTKDDYDITMPFDHLEYEKLDLYSEYNYSMNKKSLYFKDCDGHDFTEMEFC